MEKTENSLKYFFIVLFANKEINIKYSLFFQSLSGYYCISIPPGLLHHRIFDCKIQENTNFPGKCSG